ncbi:hypothetical protein OG302_42505 [Streptomyces sp. NBC_01283]|uniref:hypothetical protein n=1 Tax=Streptomyces sp. NBC_01283 TaxID=2903812 RepID=UPI00352C0039|nr:hypothetical protein OG302_42505 [Streptomyces sp. NBC_01283]
MLLGNKTPGGQTTNGLLGHWNPWTSVDAALCVDVNNVFLFKGNECIILPLNQAGNYKDTDPTPETHTAVTDPVPIATQFGYTGTQDTATFPLPKVDAAFLTAGGTNIWFFGGDQCYCIDATTHTPIDHFSSGGVPITLPIRDQWQNLPDDLKNGLTWAAPTLNSDGVVQDSAALVTRDSANRDTGSIWATVTVSTNNTTASGAYGMQLFTDPGNHPPFTVPAGVDTVKVYLWGPGGAGGTGGYGHHGVTGDGGAGGNGGSGVYLFDTLTVDSGEEVACHVGQQGDYTSVSVNTNTILIAPGGGGGGGGGSNGVAGAGGAVAAAAAPTATAATAAPTAAAAGALTAGAPTAPAGRRTAAVTAAPTSAATAAVAMAAAAAVAAAARARSEARTAAASAAAATVAASIPVAVAAVAAPA